MATLVNAVYSGSKASEVSSRIEHLG